MTHEKDWFYKYPSEVFGVIYTFKNDIPSGDEISTCTATIFDSDGTDQSTSMISNVSASTPHSATFKIEGGTAGETYEIKMG